MPFICTTSPNSLCFLQLYISKGSQLTKITCKIWQKSILLSEELVLSLVQGLLCTSGRSSGWILALKSPSCSCANTNVLARKRGKNTPLGRHEDQTSLFNGSGVHVGLKHSPVEDSSDGESRAQWQVQQHPWHSRRDWDFLREAAP